MDASIVAIISSAASGMVGVIVGKIFESRSDTKKIIQSDSKKIADLVNENTMMVVNNRFDALERTVKLEIKGIRDSIARDRHSIERLEKAREGDSGKFEQLQHRVTAIEAKLEVVLDKA